MKRWSLYEYHCNNFLNEIQIGDIIVTSVSEYVVLAKDDNCVYSDTRCFEIIVPKGIQIGYRLWVTKINK